MKEKINFQSAVEMTHKIGVDKNHPANIPSLKFLRSKYYKSVEQEVIFLPQFLRKMKFTCSRGHTFQPKWLDKRTPIDSFFLKNGMILQASTTQTECTFCNTTVSIDLPRIKHKGSVKLFGDEAIRQSADKKIYTYTLISEPTQKKHYDRFKRDFYKIKRKTLPHKHPSSWTLHYLEFFNEKKRKSSENFKHLSKKDVIDISIEIGELLKKNKKNIEIWNSTAVYTSSKTVKNNLEKEHKKIVYYPLIMQALRETTASGYCPYIHFERTQSDGWAKKLFEGGRLTLMWPFLTHGLPTPDPKFCVPTESIFFEIADFISFCVARYLYIISEIDNGKKFSIDMNPRWLGEIRYIGFTEHTSTIHKKADHYPLNVLFEGTSWSQIDTQ
ncbi:hypothetical protein ACT3RU_07050 [Halomonas sp. TP35]